MVTFFMFVDFYNRTSAFSFQSPLGHPWDPRAPASSQIPFRECPDCFQISQSAFGYVRSLRGRSQIAPCIYQDFERYPPKMVFGHNLHYMAPFNFCEDGVLHGFPARTFCFFMPGVAFWRPGSAFWAWSQHFGPGTVSGSKMGVEKHTFAMKSFCEGEVGESILPK